MIPIHTLLSSHVTSTSMSINAPAPGTVSNESFVTPQSPASGLGTSGINSSPEYPMIEASINHPTIPVMIDLAAPMISLSQYLFFKAWVRVLQKPSTFLSDHGI